MKRLIRHKSFIDKNAILNLDNIETGGDWFRAKIRYWDEHDTVQTLPISGQVIKCINKGKTEIFLCYNMSEINGFRPNYIIRTMNELGYKHSWVIYPYSRIDANNEDSDTADLTIYSKVLHPQNPVRLSTSE